MATSAPWTIPASAGAFPPTTNSATTGIQSLSSAHRSKWMVVLGLQVAEALLRLLQPLMIGLAINDLLGSSCRGLLVFAVVYLLLLLTSAIRRMATRRTIIALTVDQADDVPSGRDAQTLRLPDELTWLASPFPLSPQRFVAISGTLALLAWYDATLIPFCLMLTLPVWLLRKACDPRMSTDLRELHQIRQDVRTAGDAGQRHRLLEALRSCQLRLTDTAAIRAALADLFVLGMLTSAIVHYVGRGVAPAPAGDIFAVVSYLLLFAASLNGTRTAAWSQFPGVPFDDQTEPDRLNAPRWRRTTDGHC